MYIVQQAMHTAQQNSAVDNEQPTVLWQVHTMDACSLHAKFWHITHLSTTNRHKLINYQKQSGESWWELNNNFQT